MPRLACFALLAALAGLVAACGAGDATSPASSSTEWTLGGTIGGDATGGGGAGGAAHAGGAASTGGAGGDANVGGRGGSVPMSPYHLVGRFDESDPARPKASWSGTTMRTRVAGSSLSVRLGGAENVRFTIEIDGEAKGLLQTTGGDASYEVAKGLAPGEHDVALVRRNEGYFGSVAFLGFEPGDGASLVDTPWPWAHRIELVGDSLTAGYGIEGASADCHFSAGTESFYGTYGAVAGRAVNAAVHAIAFSGKGVFQNYGGDKTELMPELWRRTLTNVDKADWDFARFVPDAVVVNLGTNDFSAPLAEADFEGAYAKLLGDVRAAHAGALIVCVTWAHWGATKEAWVTKAMAATGDARLRHLRFAIDPADGLGCDGHTNLVTNAKLGALLADTLRSELGW